MANFVCRTCGSNYERNIFLEMKYIYRFRCIDCLKKNGIYKLVCKICNKKYNRKFYSWELDRPEMCNKCWKSYLPLTNKPESLMIIFH